MKTSMFKHIFLALTFVLLGAAVLPAAAVECRTQSHGQMVCNDGNVYQMQTTPWGSAAPAAPAAEMSTPQAVAQEQSPSFSQEELVAMQELAAIEKSEGQGFVLAAGLIFIFMAFALFLVYQGSVSYNPMMRASGIGLLAICAPMALVFTTKVMHYYMTSSPEQKIAIERQRMEVERIEQMRAIRDNAIRREAQRHAGNTTQ